MFNIVKKWLKNKFAENPGTAGEKFIWTKDLIKKMIKHQFNLEARIKRLEGKDAEK